ncbi:acetyltransferase [Baekduia alba]|nr:GNAT family N-acetyltransferase [Baekduia alba]WCB94785.1 acetyltransferase [Baekduia alba]
MLQVEQVIGVDAARLRALRLSALSGDPEGFGSTLERDLARAPSFWAEWARASEVGEEQRTFVLVDAAAGQDGDWVGLAMARIVPERPGEAELLSMWVAPAVRGGGAAELLCDACAAWTRSRGVATLVLAVYAANGRARRAYEKCGFSLDGDDAGELLRMVRAA